MYDPVPDPNQKALGLVMSRARIRADLTLDGLAEASGVSRRMLIEIEQGRANPSVKTVHAIAHATRVPVKDFVGALCDGHTPPGE